MFNLDIWKEKTYASLQNVGRWLEARKNQDAPLLLYGYLSTLTLLPLAVAAGDPTQALIALGGVFGGVGGSLLANKVQEWANRSQAVDETELAEWVTAEIARSDELRAELDLLLQKLDIVAQAQANLDPGQQQQFSRILRQELAQLGNFARFEAYLSGTGAIALGKGAVAVTATSGGQAIGVVEGDVVNQDKVLNYGTYIARQELQADPRRARLPDLEHRYLKALHHRCNVLPLAVLGGEQHSGSELKLNDVYINLNTDRRVPLSPEEQKKSPRQKERPVTALEAAGQAKLMALLGDPGSGKSTFVQQLAAWLALAQLGDREALAKLPGWSPLCWPLLTSLREVAARLGGLELAGLSEAEQNSRLVEAVAAQWQANLQSLRVAELAESLEDILAQKPVLLIFDGLDEVAEPLRPLVRRAVQAVLRTYPTIERVLVTCRSRSYTGRTVLPGFSSYTLEGFNTEQIRAFVTAWYLAQGRLNGFSPDSVVERTRDLQQAVLSKSLRLLASNPLLLTTMAIIHLRQVRLPNERVRLYSQAVQVLLDGWQKQKGIAVSTRLQAVLSDSSKMRLIMQRLAYELHQRQSREGAEAHLSRYDILAILETPAYLGDIGLGDELLSYIDQRAGLLVGLGGVESGPQPQLYNFPHRTFQEYLAGCYMATGRETSLVREYRRRAREGDYWYLAGQLGAEALLYSDRPDTERLLDLAYALCPVELPREEGEWRAVHWSGQMATLLERQVIEDDADADGGGGRAYLERLSSRLVQILAQQILSPLERAEVGQALARLGDPRPGVGLRPNGLPDITWCEVPAGPFVMGEGKAERQVELPGFNISRYSITNAQYEAFVKDGGYTARWRRCWTKTGWQWKQDREEPDRLGGVFDLPNHPAAGISWYEAVAFCRWLTGKLRAAGEISQQVEISLPGESQWEKAARGTDGRVYPWGNQASPDRANYYDTGIGTTSAVGCFPNGASPYGCEEMAGNVREWCRTKYDKPDDDSLEGEALRVMRGGGFLNNGQNVRSAVRLRSNPNGWYNDQGFRVVASPFLTLASEPSEL